MAGFTQAYQNANKNGTAEVGSSESGLKVDVTKYLDMSDPTSPFRDQIAASIARSVVGVKRPRCLDVGCATGGDLTRLAKALEGKPVQLVGVDLVGAQLEKARAALPNAEFVEGDVTALPFGADEFDSVQLSRVLIHVPDLRKGVDDMIRVMKPGAVGIFAEGDMDTSHLMTSDARLREIFQKKNEHVISMCANPRAASSTYRYLLAHPSVENVSMGTFSFTMKMEGLMLEMDRQFLQKLVENGTVTQQDLDYYMEQAEGKANAEGNFVMVGSMFDITFTKKHYSNGAEHVISEKRCKY